ncbi:MAG: HYR domain-containing protein [Saprospiraceae bacterium]
MVDWCAYTGPNGNNQGIWTGDQTIKISDNEAPQLFLPDNITIGASNTSCSGLVTLAPASAQDCSNNVSITNNSPYAISGGADASGSYPVGTHVVKFTAFDGCGNTTSGNVTITVVDDKPPTPVCNRGITISLNSDGEVYLTPAIIAQTAFDNCASLQNIRLEISPSTFTCGDLGEQDVTLHALDPR